MMCEQPMAAQDANPLAGYLESQRLPRGFPGEWAGRFIWDHGDSVPRHYHLMARRTFTLDSPPSTATVIITANDRYQLYVNGTYVGRGAARMTRPHWTPYDTYRITQLLEAGRNTIAVLAHHYGCPNNYTSDMRAGLFCQLEVLTDVRSERLISTDEEWRVCPMQGYRRDTPVINNFQGIANEILDARADPVDWMLPDFDDSAWERARELIAEVDTLGWNHVEDSSWSCLEPRRVPLLQERPVAPIRVVQKSEAVSAPVDTDREESVHERLVEEAHAALSHASIEGADSITSGTSAVRMTDGITADGLEHRSPVLVLDFGRPIVGVLEIRLTSPPGAVVDIIYGTTLAGESDLMRVGREKSLRVGDRLITRQGSFTWRLSDVRLIRYLQIVLRESNSPVVLESVRMIAMEYPTESEGGFECSQPILNRIWEAGRNTVYLHMEDTHVCDASRERRQYSVLQELRGGIRGIYAAYGDPYLPAEALLSTRRMQLPNGMIPAYSGSTGKIYGFPRLSYAVGSFNGVVFPNQSWGYALAVWEHYMRFGGRRFLELHYPALELLSKNYDVFIDRDGLLGNLPSTNFMDWVGHEVRGANLFLNAGYASMLEAMAWMGAELEQPRVKREALQTRCDEIRATVRRLHWDEERGLFTDSLVNGGRSPVFSVMTNAYAVLLDVASPYQTQRIAEKVLAPEADLLAPTPLEIGAIADGLFKAGVARKTLAMLSRKFERMVAHDFPTLSESWVEEMAKGQTVDGVDLLLHSHIHDSPCGVMMTFHEGVLGVSPRAPGYARCLIQPNLGGLDWAEGAVPTPHGLVHVALEQSADAELRFDIETPDMMPITLALHGTPAPWNLQLDHATVGEEAVVVRTERLTGVPLLCVDLCGGKHSGILVTDYCKRRKT